MRAPVLAALTALIALPLAASTATLPWAGPEPQAPADAAPLSHGFWTPYMHTAALDIPAGIRPGAWLQIGLANCTAAFVVRDAANALYITTAGHCTDHVGQRAAVKEGVLLAHLGQMEPFGTVVARWPQGLDAALIAIDPAKYPEVDPRMAGWGGPTGLVTANPGTAAQVLHYGWGWVTWLEHQSRCRRGVLEAFGGTVWWHVGVGGGGDSGSAVMTADGRALGILDWGGLVVPTPTGAFVSLMEGGVRFDRVLAALKATTGKDLALVEGGPVNPVCVPEPPLPPLP